MVDFCINGECSRCGNCCMPCVPITLQEYHTIKKYISEKDIKYEAPQPYINEQGEPELDCRCCFYDKHTKSCKIYEVRPEVCQKYKCDHSPLIIEMRKHYYDNRADINGKHLDRLIPFDLLFYGSPINTLYLPLWFLKDKSKFTPQYLNKFLYEHGKDRAFIDKHKLNSTWDILEGIKNKEIQLEWSE